MSYDPNDCFVSSADELAYLRGDLARDGLRQQRRCVCPSYTTRRECLRLRYDFRTIQNDEECECVCHDRDDDDE